MMPGLPVIEAELYGRLPEALHWRGEPNDWVRMTRPGMRLHSFLEGPCLDDDGALWLVDVPYGRIFKVDKSGDWTLAHQYEGEPHSIKSLGPRGYMLVDYKLGLLSFASDGPRVEVVADNCDDVAFLGLSDLTVLPSGDLWFTDSGRTSLSDPSGRVFHRSAAGQIRLVLDTVPYPNGIAASADGAFIYVAATRSNQILRLSATLPPSGRPMSGTFIQLSGGLGPDGLAVSTTGLLAIAQAQAGRAYLASAVGDLVAQIRLPEGRWTTSVVFGRGGDAGTLYIVEAQTASIYRADITSFQES